MTIKDTLETNGVICTGGTKGRANFVPKADATSVARLRAAGGHHHWQDQCPRTRRAIETDNLVTGAPTIPMTSPGPPGGSQRRRVRDCRGLRVRRSASAPTPVAASRIPAHFCGLAAIKPTSGRVPRTGQFTDADGCRATRCFTSA